jgi:hypothetical protein
MSRKEKMTFEMAVEKLMMERFPEKFTKRDMPTEMMAESWITLDNKVKRVALIQKRSTDIVWEDIAREIVAEKDVTRFVSGCHYSVGLARKNLGSQR